MQESQAGPAEAESPCRRRRFLRSLKLRPLDRNEISGSLGDLGTFIPLLVGMSITNGLDFTAALFFAGVFNIVTGLAFSIPMAVQPMKAIAAVAISEQLPVTQILAAGIWTSAIILLLGLTHTIVAIDRLIPKSVVRGLQLGLGLQLLARGVLLVRDTGVFWGLDSMLVGILGFGLVLGFASTRRVPVALLLFIGGLVLAVAAKPHILSEVRPGFYFPSWVPLTWADFSNSFVRAALPQIPLTTLNSVIAVCALSADLFPERPARPRKVAISVGFMNIIAGWFGAMPMCHGAGGLAGQYRFGARSSTSILFLGSAKIVLAVVFGSSILALLHSYPQSVLGVLLGISGLELALVARDQSGRTAATVMYATAAAVLALESTATGFIIGWVLALVVGRSRDGNGWQPEADKPG